MMMMLYIKFQKGNGFISYAKIITAQSPQNGGLKESQGKGSNLDLACEF